MTDAPHRPLPMIPDQPLTNEDVDEALFNAFAGAYNSAAFYEQGWLPEYADIAAKWRRRAEALEQLINSRASSPPSSRTPDAIRELEETLAELEQRDPPVSRGRIAAMKSRIAELREKCPNPHCDHGFIRDTKVGCATCGGRGASDAAAPAPTDTQRLDWLAQRVNMVGVWDEFEYLAAKHYAEGRLARLRETVDAASHRDPSTPSTERDNAE